MSARKPAVLILASVVLVAVACGGPPNGTTRSTASSRPPELSPGSREERWTGTIDSTSYHRLYVGGTCTTDWLTRFTFTVAPDGTVTGAGAARLTSEGEPCPFPVAERQVREFTVEVAGEVRGGNMHLRLAEVSHRPSAGAEDLGGFRATVLADLKVSELLVHLDPNERAASAKVKITVAGPDRDEFASTNIVRLDRTGSG